MEEGDDEGGVDDDEEDEGEDVDLWRMRLRRRRRMWLMQRMLRMKTDEKCSRGGIR